MWLCEMKSTVVAVIAALSQGALAFAPAAAPDPRSGVLALRAQVGLFEQCVFLPQTTNVCLCVCLRAWLVCFFTTVFLLRTKQCEIA